MRRKVELDKTPNEIVKELISKYIPDKPMRISLKLDWYNNHSYINIISNDTKKKVEYQLTIDFTSFAHGVLDAYKDAYGEIDLNSTSFRKEKYGNEKVGLDLYPTGSAGIFDIYVEYKKL